MNILRYLSLITIILIALPISIVSQIRPPVNSNATKEAKQLLSYIYSISGKQTLTAQHEQLWKMSIFTDSIQKITGKKPSIWGGEFGFSDERHDVDNIKYRPRLLEEIIKHHNDGAIITMTYHQANPVQGEPCLFEEGVQYKMTPEQYKELLTNGSPIYNNWKSMVDKLADMFQTLQEKNIPVLFRPYHEMNGGWFWWSGQKGDSNCLKLYIQLYDYLTYKRNLNNLIWVWSPSNQNFNFKEYYPGDQYVDMVGSDIYPAKKGDAPELVYSQEVYNAFVSFAGNKPLCIGECSTMPTIEILEKQPRWVWMMGWVDLVFSENSTENIKQNYNVERTITRDEIQIGINK